MALEAHEGLCNCSMKLVKFNRGRLEKISIALSVLESKLKKLLGLVNEIIVFF